MDTDFFSLDFSELFLNKHGEKIYTDICNMIKKEFTNWNTEYISIVFKVAFLCFFGLDKQGSQKLINDYYPGKNINVSEIVLNHNNSISEITKYLQNTMKNEK